MITDSKAIIESSFDAKNDETPFGKRWGEQVIKLTADDLQLLKQGKSIALDVMNEYVVYLQLENINK